MQGCHLSEPKSKDGKKRPKLRRQKETVRCAFIFVIIIFSHEASDVARNSSKERGIFFFGVVTSYSANSNSFDCVDLNVCIRYSPFSGSAALAENACSIFRLVTISPRCVWPPWPGARQCDHFINDS